MSERNEPNTLPDRQDQVVQRSDRPLSPDRRAVVKAALLAAPAILLLTTRTARAQGPGPGSAGRSGGPVSGKQ